MHTHSTRRNPARLLVALIAALALTATVVAGPAQATTSSSSTADVDAEFVRMMIPHHYQALLMSRMAPDSTGNDQLRALATRIDVEQSVEIAMMQAWQRRHGHATTDPAVAYEMMLQNPAMLETMGMATRRQMNRLDRLSNRRFDRTFLRRMIRHHQGAVDMIIDLEINGSDPYLRQMALDMLNTQMIQIDQMEAMLG